VRAIRSLNRLLPLALTALLTAASAWAASPPPLFSRTNLVAWCIVPFDAKARGPEARAQMLDRLGLRRLAYDWRAEHVPTFDAEVEAMKRHGIELTAWWFPGALDADASNILAVIERHGIHPQLWVTGGGEPTSDAADQTARIAAESGRLRPIARAAGRLGCQVGLYNHGGWFGEPENQFALVQQLRADGLTNVGLVYNFHHGHDHLARFPELWRRMQPHLLAVNLNGMIAGGDATGLKILHLGEGDRELELLRVIRDSGWQGPVGILDHRPETDSEETLSRNLRGLDWLLRELDQPGSGGPKPTPPAPPPTPPPVAPPTTGRTDLPEAFGAALTGGAVVRGDAPFPTNLYWQVEDPAARAALPEFETVPAAESSTLTPANGHPQMEVHRTWQRSHGNAHGARFSALDQIHRGNVTNLQVARTYRAGDGLGNLQCNPIIVNGLMIAPTPGQHLVGVAAGRRFVVVPATGGGKLGSPPGDAYVAFALPSSAPH